MNHEELKTHETENPEFSDELIGQTFGVYQITKEIGRGGMGVVYLAKRVDGEFNQNVAVKFVKRGMDTDAILKRFRNERQILASLIHPNVALLYDGGTTRDGLPYFVMEYIEGKPLYEFCDHRKLNIKERLKIFLQICEAIHEVHQIKVIHRDLKPSNILVTKDAVPKLLDFGIAKLLDPELADATIDPTATQMRVMTPEYASPEQVMGGEITIASDIYSLGVLLYELLSGHRPYRLKNRSPLEIARVICEEPPDRFDESVDNKETFIEKNESQTSENIAELRGLTLENLRRELSGELEQLVINALQKEPDERYQTALEFAEDIRLYLRDKPIKKRAAFPVKIKTSFEDKQLIESASEKIVTAEMNTEKVTSEFKEEEKLSPVTEKSFFGRHVFKFGFAAILAVGILTAYLTGILTVEFSRGDKILENAITKRQPRSIAILPFTNETSDAGNDYLCDGLSENLINRLTDLPDVRVMSRSTAFSYKGKQTDPRQIGREMNVETILVGSVHKENNEFLVKTELINVVDGMRIFAADFREKSDNVSDLQNEIASRVVEKLNVQNQEAPRVPKIYTENNEAFQLYMKGEFHRQKATPDDIRKSIEFYEQALQLDSNFALAYQGLAFAYRSSPAYGTLSPQEAYPRAKEAAMKALAIDPTLGTAHVPLASIKAIYDWDFEGAEREYKQAIQLAPNNAEAHYSYGNFLVAMGRGEEALTEYRIAQQFDPLSSNIATNIGWALYVAGRFDEAEIQVKAVLAREPNFARAYMNLGEINEEQGKYDEAIAAFQKSKQLSGDVLADMALGHVYAVAGRRAEALRIAQELEEKVLRKEVSPFLPAVVYAGLKENDKAFYWLERAYQEHSNWLTLLKIGRRLKPLHGDPRFADLLKRIGLEK